MAPSTSISILGRICFRSNWCGGGAPTAMSMNSSPPSPWLMRVLSFNKRNGGVDSRGGVRTSSHLNPTNSLIYSTKRWSSGTTVNKSAFRKQQRGRMKGISHRGNHICFGKFALQAVEPAWITSRQIEAGRRAIIRNARAAKIWVRIIPDKPVTVRPPEMRMGKGKGSPEYRVAVVQPGRILYEIGGVTQSIAKRGIIIAASKLPIATRFIVLG